MAADAAGERDAGTMERIAALLAELGSTAPVAQSAPGSPAPAAAAAAAAAARPVVSAEWARRARDKHESERAVASAAAVADTSVSDETQRPWRDAPSVLESPRLGAVRSSQGEAEFLQRQARARQRREEQNPDRVFAVRVPMCLRCVCVRVCAYVYTGRFALAPAAHGPARVQLPDGGAPRTGRTHAAGMCFRISRCVFGRCLTGEGAGRHGVVLIRSGDRERLCCDGSISRACCVNTANQCLDFCQLHT
jgi:hypothetical protein